MAPDRHDPALRPADHPPGQRKRCDGTDVFDPKGLLCQTHGVHENCGVRLGVDGRKAQHIGFGQSRRIFQLPPRKAVQLLAHLLVSPGVMTNEGHPESAAILERLEDAVHERDIAADGDGVEVIHQARAE